MGGGGGIMNALVGTVANKTQQASFVPSVEETHN